MGSNSIIRNNDFEWTFDSFREVLMSLDDFLMNVENLSDCNYLEIQNKGAANFNLTTHFNLILHQFNGCYN